MIVLEDVYDQASHTLLRDGYLSTSDVSTLRLYKKFLSKGDMCNYIGNLVNMKQVRRNIVRVACQYIYIDDSFIRAGCEELLNDVASKITNGVNSEFDLRSLASLLILDDIYGLKLDYSKLSVCDFHMSDQKYWHDLYSMLTRFTFLPSNVGDSFLVFYKLSPLIDEWVDYEFDY